MSLSTLYPLVGIAIAVVLSGSVRRWLDPAAATRLLTIVAVGSAIAVGWALILVVFAWGIAYPEFTEVATWCGVVTPGHHPVGTALGVGALLILLVGTTRALLVLRRFRRSDAAWHDVDAVEIVSSADPVAFAVPGSPGSVVVSTGLLRNLEQPQCDAVLAHEQAHLVHRHHRYVRLTKLASTAVPLLAPLDRWVSVSTERWADEDAADAVGDRRTVASALVATATATAAADGVLHFNHSSLHERVDALINPRRARPCIVGAALAIVWGAVAMTLLSNSVQLHHLASFAEHVCTRA